MKQRLTLLLFFFCFSLSAQILTNSNSVNSNGIGITYSEWVYPRPTKIALDTVFTSFYSSTAVNGKNGDILFFLNNALTRAKFFSKNGWRMPNDPSIGYSNIIFGPVSYNGNKVVYLGSQLYRCYYAIYDSVFSYTIDMNLNNGLGDVIDSIPQLHYKTSDKKPIYDLQTVQTDSLSHKVILLSKAKWPYADGPFDSIGMATIIHTQGAVHFDVQAVKLPYSQEYVTSNINSNSDIEVSNSKNYAVVLNTFLYRIDNAAPVFVKSIPGFSFSGSDNGVNSVFSPDEKILYTAFRNDSLFTIIQSYVDSLKKDTRVFNFTVPPAVFQNSYYNDFYFKLFPNRKMLIQLGSFTYPYRNWVQIHRPDVFGEGCMIDTNGSIYKDLVPFYFPSDIATPLHFSRFGLHAIHNDCGGSTIPNLSDSLFKSFVWYLPSGDSLVKNTREDIRVKFKNGGLNVVVLKGITETGYKAWFTDSIETGCFVKANFYSKDSLGCQWIAQTFVDSSCLNTYLYDPGTKWTWDFGDGDIVQSDTPVVSHVFKSSGYFKVKMTIQNKECIDSITKAKAIFIKPAPKPGFKLSSNDWCKSFPIILEDNIVSGFTQKIYVWGDGDSIVSTDATTLFHHTYTQLGSYTITQYVYSVSGCVNKLEQAVHIYPSYRLADAIPAPAVSVVNNFNTALRFQGVENPKGYQLFRSDLGWFETIKDTAFIDYATTVSEHKYTYAVRVMDYCNNVSLTSEKENSILLTGSPRKQYDVVLTANRSLVSNEPHQLMTETSSGEFVELVYDFNNTFTDTKFYNDSMWDRTYFIQYCSKTDTSCERVYSNKIVFTYVPDVFIPSIISKSQNPFFVPRVTLMSSGSIVIYDIMGRKVYESDHLNDPIYIDHFGQGYHVYTVEGKSRDRKDYSDRGKMLVIE